ncbi:MAG TPA: hypothetical protein VHT05_00650 [Candidatus Elarobacter sp.]|nr:hypothetical protein [Candidatus Elarobacter sp.]
MNEPKPGDVIYVDTDLYVSHGADDFRGGKATVVAVQPGRSKSTPVAFVEVEQNPGCLYNWEMLAEKQAELAAQFGDAWAHPDPDYRPEFNDGFAPRSEA